MKLRSEMSSKRYQTEECESSSLQEFNSSVVVLKFLEPPRELLRTQTKTNCAYTTDLNTLPYIFKCCELLHPLAQNISSMDYAYIPEMLKNVYRRDLQLKINPFMNKSYFKSPQKTEQLKPINTPEFVEAMSLTFDSHFESGNLLSADKELTTENTYHLMMQNDINTYGCTQWFFFKTKNKKIQKATFFINNFYKPQSLYQKGMKVLIFSTKKFLNEGIGWVRGGEEIIYFPNKSKEKKDNSGFAKQFYSLKFSYHFDYEDDEVYFAYTYPYTYSKLNTYLIEKESVHNSYYSCRTICQTAAQNKVFLVTITDQSIPKEKKNSIFLTSRVHPGETVSSLMMEGIIDFLTSNDPVAKTLREKFIFKLIPMLNPDGVIHGNYRTNLAGIDLNRVWSDTDRFLSPEIFELKKYVTQFNKECPVVMFCDLHGHSSRKSAFVYGCESEKWKLLKEGEESRVFPFMLSFENDDFRYKSCSFNIQKNKKGTARIQLWKELKIPNIYTLEASFCSSENSEYHFRPTDYSEIGISFCKTIHEYFLNPDKRREFHEKLRLSKENTLHKNEDSEDSESENDLLDTKALTDLKNGKGQGIWQKRKIIIEKTVDPVVIEEVQEKKIIPRRRYISDKTTKINRTEFSPDFLESASNILKKSIVAPIPTKRFILESEILRVPEPKGYLKQSIFQRVEHNYRGKSSVYRIQRKNLKTTLTEVSSINRSSIFETNKSMEHY